MTPTAPSDPSLPVADEDFLTPRAEETAADLPSDAGADVVPEELNHASQADDDATNAPEPDDEPARVWFANEQENVAVDVPGSQDAVDHAKNDLSDAEQVLDPSQTAAPIVPEYNAEPETTTADAGISKKKSQDEIDQKLNGMPADPSTPDVTSELDPTSSGHHATEIADPVGAVGTLPSDTVNDEPAPKPFKKGVRFKDKDARNEGRTVQIKEVLPLDEYLVETESHPLNPEAVGRQYVVSGETLRERYKKQSR